MAHQTSPFPLIRTIEDVLPVIDGRKEFITVVKDGYTVIDYVMQLPDTFGCLVTADPQEAKEYRLRRELRGIKFCSRTGRLLARGFHKFFNLNEREETQSHRIDWTEPHVVLEKLDGSMIHAGRIAGRLRLMTMMGTTPIAQQAEAFALDHGAIDYRGFLHEAAELGLTPIFEWCSRANRVIIDYPKPQLVLTGLRALLSGRYVPYQGLVSYADPFKVPVVQAWGNAGGSNDGNTIGDLDAFLTHVRALRDAEGYVVCFDNGTRLKLKADNYVMRHRAKENIFQERNIVRYILENRDDDLVAMLPPEDAKAVAAYAAAWRQGLRDKAEEIARKASNAFAAAGRDPKTYSQDFVLRLPSGEQGPAYASSRGQDPMGSMTHRIGRHLGSGPRLDVVRPLWNGVAWKDFWQSEDEALDH